MLKRLLTAVLILAIFMVFSSTAFSGTSNIPGGGANDYKNVVHKSTGTSARTKAMPKKKLVGNPESLPSAKLMTQRPTRPSPTSTDTTLCGQTDYFSPAATYFITFPRTSAATGSREFAMRFDGPSMPNYDIRVNGTYNWIYRTAEGGVSDGAVHVVVSVYSDAVGSPGALVYSENYALPIITNTFSYTYFPFTTPPVVTGPYHISFKVDPTGPSTDTCVFTSDDAGYPSIGTGISAQREHIESAVNPGVWYDGLTFYGNGFDPDFSQVSDWCMFYSSCYTAETPSNFSFQVLAAPDPTWPGGETFQGVGQQFMSLGHDTVTSVTLYHYDFGVQEYPLAGTNGVQVDIWGDSAGQPWVSAGALATVIVPGGVASLFPNTGDAGAGFNIVNVPIPSHPVVIGPWHVTARMTSNNPADGVLEFLVNADPGDAGRTGGDVSYSAPANLWQRTGISPTWTGVGLGERAFFFDVGLCKDEFYNCQNQITYSNPFASMNTDWTTGAPPSGASRQAEAQLIQGGPGGQPNRIDSIKLDLDFAGQGTPGARVFIAADAGPSGPGPVLWSTVLTYAQLLPTYNGLTTVVIPGGYTVSNNFYVGVQIVPADATDSTAGVWYLYGERTNGSYTSIPINGGMWFLSNADGLWHNRAVEAGDGANGGFEVDFCSIPPSEWTCGPADNFPTAGHDYGRTGHANVAVNDAYCRLTLKWGYTDAQALTVLGRVGSGAPIVFDTFVVCNFGTKYQIFDLNNGAILKTITGSGAPNFITNSGGLSCTPTIANITISGTPTNVLFLGGGTTGSIDAFNMDVAGFPLIWSINGTTFAGLGYPGTLGNTAFVNFVTLNISGTDYLYFCTGGVRLYQAVAATGHIGTWGPISFPAPTFRGLASDGASLYLTQAALPPGVPNGDVYSINATTGAVNWQLSTAAGGGLKGDGTVYTAGDYGPETFPSGLAVNGGTVYTVSAPMLQPNPTFPADGVFYRINSSTGAVKSAVASAHVPCWSASGNLQQGNVLVDAAHIIVPSASTWAVPPLGGNILFYNSFTGLFAGSTTPGNHTGGNNAPRADGFLTCEPGAADQLFVGSTFGYMSDINADDFSEIFNRRIDINPPFNAGADDRMAGLAIAKTGEVLVTSLQGTLQCLSSQSPRPRLEIMNYQPQAATYGPLTSVIVDFGPIFTNTGCLPLTGSIYAFNASNGSAPGAPKGYNPPRSLSYAASIADRLTKNSLSFKASPAMAPTEEISSKSSRLLNKAATASVPTFLNGTGIYPFNLNPGDTGHIVVDVKQNLILRGPNVFWADFQSNDPDFFLNNTSEEPECVCTIVGGCLIDTTTLQFGAGAANWALISNTGRIADGNWTAAAGSWFVDGDNKASMYQGTYVYGVSYARIALNTNDWFADGNGWFSLQADPNLCDVDCKPALTSSVSLGSITSNGVVYTPLTGNLICRTMLDSVQNFGPPNFASWSWENYTAPFDNDSTMGLYMTSRVVGFVNAPAPYTQLNNVVVDFLKVSQRDQTRTLSNWRMGAVIDYDLGKDSADYDASSSLAWDFPTSATTGAWGWIKLPFGGCGVSALPPIRNVKALNEDQALFNQTAAVHGNGYLDSAYFDLNQVGRNNQNSPAGSDQACSFGFIAHNFVPGADTVQFAMAHFALPSITNNKNVANYQPLAHLLNKWTGAERGDVNNDGVLNLADIVYLAKYINGGAGTPGPIPFLTCGDANGDGLINAADVTYLINYYFYYGPCPVTKLVTY